jgi:outer membrane protein TolC
MWIRIPIVLVPLVLAGTVSFGQTFSPPPPGQAPAEQASQAIDLPTALRLATTSNLDIAQARLALDQARAARQRAMSRVLPNVTTGATYLDHNGRIQKGDGNIIGVNRDSLLVGATTSLSLDLADAVFLPLAARQFELASRAATVRVTNDTLLAVADTYIAVLRAQRRLERADMTLLYLTDEKPSAARGGAKGLLPVVRDFVEAGGKDALRSDLARLQVEVLRRKEERVAIVQDLRTAAAELARLLRLDPQSDFSPLESRWGAMAMPGTQWLTQRVDTLIDFALRNRPEVAENQALVRMSLDRERGAKMRPYLPQVQLSYFAGGFGGGPVRDTRSKITQDPNGPIDLPITGTGTIGNFGSRIDFGATMGWQLQGLGFGNRAEIRESQALFGQSQIRLLYTRDRIAAQVVQTHAALVQTSGRLWTTWDAIADKNGKPAGPIFESIRLNFERIRAGEGRPLEALDSIRGLNDILEAYANGLSDYERARFRLLAVLGVPAEALLEQTGIHPPPPPAGTPPARIPPADR